MLCVPLRSPGSSPLLLAASARRFQLGMACQPPPQALFAPTSRAVCSSCPLPVMHSHLMPRTRHAITCASPHTSCSHGPLASCAPPTLFGASARRVCSSTGHRAPHRTPHIMLMLSCSLVALMLDCGSPCVVTCSPLMHRRLVSVQQASLVCTAGIPHPLAPSQPWYSPSCVYSGDSGQFAPLSSPRLAGLSAAPHSLLSSSTLRLAVSPS